jgi:hypothetical protein
MMGIAVFGPRAGDPAGEFCTDSDDDANEDSLVDLLTFVGMAEARVDVFALTSGCFLFLLPAVDVVVVIDCAVVADPTDAASSATSEASETSRAAAFRRRELMIVC